MTTIDHSKPVPDSSQVNSTKETRITIIRTPHDDQRPYFSMSRYTAQDRSLSWEARGVLAYLLSKPSDWKIIIADLKQNCGRDKVRKILDELKASHYLVISQAHDEKGHFTAEYQLYETPFTEKPSTVNQYTVKPETVKRPLHNTDTQKTENKRPTRAPLLDPFFDAIAFVWDTRATGFVNNMKAMMLGISRSGEWSGCNFEPPANPAEILEFGKWYKRKNPDLSLPRKPEKIQHWFYEYRAEQVKLQKAKEARASLPPLTVVTPAQSTEPELTAEQRIALAEQAKIDYLTMRPAVGE